jgi:hypothetical protein
MRLFGVSMVRNEADIIEASVRHNLTVLDGLVIIDHASLDATAAILARLQTQGLPVRLVRDDDPAFFQAERLTYLARETLRGEGADFVFPIDADEFIKTPSREKLEAELSDLPPDAHAVVHWLTYVPESFAIGHDAFGPSHLRWRLKVERHGTYKCVIGRAFARRKEQYILSGNHLVDDPTLPKPPPHVRLRSEMIALAHCPVRSRAQLERKITLGYRAHLATQPANDKQNLHWAQLYDELRSGAALTPARLREIACNYGLPREKWQPVDRIELVEDPVPLSARSE